MKGGTIFVSFSDIPGAKDLIISFISSRSYFVMWDNQIISSFAFSFFLCCDRSRLLSFFKGKSKNRTFQEISQDINGNIVEDETITLQDVQS